jgi:hypothetical protein
MITGFVGRPVVLMEILIAPVALYNFIVSQAISAKGLIQIRLNVILKKLAQMARRTVFVAR